MGLLDNVIGILGTSATEAAKRKAAQFCYEAFREFHINSPASVMVVTRNGSSVATPVGRKSVPEWEDLTERQQSMWMDAVKRVLEKEA
jgi:hypothetical protein